VGVKGSPSLTPTPRKELTMYTLQIDRNRNLIICKGDVTRNGYTIIAHGSYNDLLAEKARIILAR
jgi:hypothetical protein